MKNEVLYLLLNNYADHEAVFLASAIACDERSIKENPKYMNKVVAPTLDVVRSCSGFHTLPDYSFETMPNDYAALVLIGGFGWFDELEADKVVPIVRRFLNCAGKSSVQFCPPISAMLLLSLPNMVS